jgi:hypothetical protein
MTDPFIGEDFGSNPGPDTDFPDRFCESSEFLKQNAGIVHLRERESVNMSQIDIKRKTYDIRIGKKQTHISRHILRQH